MHAVCRVPHRSSRACVPSTTSASWCTPTCPNTICFTSTNKFSSSTYRNRWVTCCFVSRAKSIRARRLIRLCRCVQVEHDHPHAMDFLRKDVANVNKFFCGHGVAVLSVRELFDFVVSDKICDMDHFLEEVRVWRLCHRPCCGLLSVVCCTHSFALSSS